MIGNESALISCLRFYSFQFALTKLFADFAGKAYGCNCRIDTKCSYGTWKLLDVFSTDQMSRWDILFFRPLGTVGW